jgi:ribosomal protein S18 acetylase RimI-like enzyme
VETSPWVRPATEDDLPAIEALTLDLAAMQSDWRVFPTREGFERDIVARYRQLLHHDRAIVLVAGSGEAVDAMACGQILTPSRFSDEPAVELSGVVVSEAARGGGLGRALVLAVAGFAREKGVERVVLDTFESNRDAVAYWMELGFRPRVIQFTVRAQDLLDTL